MQKVEDNVISNIYWKDLRVGDQCLIKNEEVIPADILQLSSSNDDGGAFMQTSNQDGEKALKPRYSVVETFAAIGMIKKDMQITKGMRKISTSLNENVNNTLPMSQRVNAYIEEPSISLYHFEGYIKFIEEEVEQKNPIPIDVKNFLFKGARVKNTDWLLGLTQYTGRNTKMQLNSGEARIKYSTLSRKQDKVIAIQFVFQLVQSSFGFFGREMVNAHTGGNYQKWIDEHQPALKESADSLLNFLKYAVILQFIIPISLVVSMEIVKFGQIILMSWSLSLKSKSGRFCKVNTVTINEELGQIEYIQSDKTGTLTVNKMEFITCNIAGHTFGGDFYKENGHTHFDNKQVRQNISFDTCNQEFFDSDLHEVLHKQTSFKRKQQKLDLKSKADVVQQTEIETLKFGNREYKCSDLVKLFFQSLAICNECLLENTDNNDEDNDNEVKEVKHDYCYTSSSPDEIALCSAARQFGLVLKKRTGEDLLLDMFGKEEEFKIPILFEFDSERKAQSIITKYNGDYILFTKGADSSIINLLDPKIEQTHQADTKTFLYSASVMGLRTLCFGFRVLSNDEFNDIQNSYHDIMSKPERDKNVKIQAKKVEKDLILIGSTAIEDKLQENVAETIEKCRNADIKVWMITGDKLETAENIALSCGIVNLDMAVFSLKDTTPDTLLEGRIIYSKVINRDKED